MPVEADPVTGAMRQPRHFVIRTKSGVGNDFARRRVDDFARRAHLDRGKPRILRLTFEVPDLPLAGGRFAENERTRDV